MYTPKQNPTPLIGITAKLAESGPIFELEVDHRIYMWNYADVHLYAASHLQRRIQDDQGIKLTTSLLSALIQWAPLVDRIVRMQDTERSPFAWLVALRFDQWEERKKWQPIVDRLNKLSPSKKKPRLARLVDGFISIK